MKKRFMVECTMIYNGNVIIEAENWEEACDKASEQMNQENLEGFPDSGMVGDIKFVFGEATADYVEELNEDEE